MIYRLVLAKPNGGTNNDAVLGSFRSLTRNHFPQLLKAHDKLPDINIKNIQRFVRSNQASKFNQ